MLYYKEKKKEEFLSWFVWKACIFALICSMYEWYHHIHTSLLYCQMWVSPPHVFGLIFFTESLFFFYLLKLDKNIVNKNF